jgi:hypothetical protein
MLKAKAIEHAEGAKVSALHFLSFLKCREKEKAALGLRSGKIGTSRAAQQRRAKAPPMY